MKTLIENLLTGLILTLIFSFTSMSQGNIDRMKRPVPGPAPKIKLPEIQKAVLSNGLNVWLVEKHELPTVAFNLVIQAGADHDPKGQPGMASMTADLLDEGTKSRSTLEISDEIESIGASFGVYSNFDGSYMTLNVLKKYMERGLNVFSDVLSNPVFPVKEFERLKVQRLAALLQQRDQPVAIANNAFSYILYGTDHPYGNNPAGNEASLKALSRDDIQMFYQSCYRPNNATLIVVGDIKLGEVTAILDRTLSGWKKGDVAPFTVPDPKSCDKMRVYLIDKPGAPQSEIRIGYPALSRSTPDYFPVQVMNRMLGGQFTSRINLNLREKHGFTYGARSGFSFQKGAGPFTASSGVTTEKSDSSLREFLYEINLMREKGMTAEELEFVKKGLLGNFALTFETPAQIAGALQSIILYGLPENYFNNYLQNIDAVTLKDVDRVSKKYLDTSKMAVVIVGDLSKIKEPIASMKVGDVTVCDTDGKPLK